MSGTGLVLAKISARWFSFGGREGGARVGGRARVRFIISGALSERIVVCSEASGQAASISASMRRSISATVSLVSMLAWFVGPGVEEDSIVEVE